MVSICWSVFLNLASIGPSVARAGIVCWVPDLNPPQGSDFAHGSALSFALVVLRASLLSPTELDALPCFGRGPARTMLGLANFLLPL